MACRLIWADGLHACLGEGPSWMDSRSDARVCNRSANLLAVNWASAPAMLPLCITM